MGECIDNARCSLTFAGVAEAAGKLVKEMPFALTSPEWSNEKGLGASYAFRLLGINSYHCVYPPAQGSEKVMKHVMDSENTLGSTMNVDVDPDKVADMIISDLNAKREKLGWV